MLKSPANLSLSLKKASSLNWGDLNSIYFLFNSTVTAKNGQAPPAFTGKDQKNILIYVTLSIDFLRDVGNGVSPFLRVARTTHMHQLLKHNVQGQIPCIFLHYQATVHRELAAASAALFQEPHSGIQIRENPRGKTQNILGRVFRVE